MTFPARWLSVAIPPSQLLTAAAIKISEVMTFALTVNHFSQDISQSTHNLQNTALICSHFPKLDFNVQHFTKLEF
jgi:hypothetical protein